MKKSVQYVCDHPDEYTDLEVRLARYIHDHAGMVSEMSVSRLGEAAYVSVGSVMRFVQKLGYEGFSDFKGNLIRETESRKYRQETVDFHKPFHNYANTPDVVQSMSSLYKETIDVIQAGMDLRQIEKITDLMYNAKRLYLCGTGDSNVTCQSFSNRLIKLNINAVLVNTNGEGVTFANNDHHGDVVVGVSYSGLSLSSVCRTFKAHGAKVIVMTANPLCEAAKSCDELILIENKEGSIGEEKISTFYSQLAFGYLFNIFYSLMYNRYQKLKTQKEMQKKLYTE